MSRFLPYDLDPDGRHTAGAPAMRGGVGSGFGDHGDGRPFLVGIWAGA